MAISHCYWHLVVNNGNSTLFNSIRGQSDLFTVKCCHWDSKADIPPIQHYQRTEWSLHCSMLSLTLKGRYPHPVNPMRTEWSLHCLMLSLTLKGRYTPLVNIAEDRVISSLFNVVIDTQRQIYPPFNTIRGQSDLFTVQCCHWHSKADIPPWSTLSEDRVISSLFNVVIDTQRQIYSPFNTIRGQSDLFTVQCCHWHSKADIPPIQHYQRKEWSLHCSMLSLTLKGRYTPHSTLAEDRVISSLFNVVIDTQRQIYPHSQHYQRTEWSLHCSMLSLTLKGRYTPNGQHYQRTEWSLHCSMLSLRLKGRYNPPFNTIRGQSDLFTVQCCHWHSKADIPPHSTLSEDRVISSLFNVVIDTQRQIYPPVQHYQRTEWSLHCSMLSLTLKGRYTPAHLSSSKSV